MKWHVYATIKYMLFGITMNQIAVFFGGTNENAGFWSHDCSNHCLHIHSPANDNFIGWIVFANIFPFCDWLDKASSFRMMH